MSEFQNQMFSFFYSSAQYVAFCVVTAYLKICSLSMMNQPMKVESSYPTVKLAVYSMENRHHVRHETGYLCSSG